ncbi:transketolase [Legionella longbeachae]|uniref:Transketolase n=1 Tax=Legionella longbeachae serogroup 1 (strain NSW150) TaxID=661367 RepID=D3HMM5_LEGLN|nr:transketolase [Legionella longbeachae]VEE04226.1 transketolase [Legionella oakridgensis]HBD7396996.1 transketolase [Legionella pneumophila]ARB92946.1 transketolase [Legionella longbeachae]ARM33914.1 transketolase [Legionella longbeachae]EEZ96884.1 transketolase [Legionella longbeachae D-4968]
MNLCKELANAIRILSVDAVEQAQSGHPGMPLGMADIATVLWKKFLKHNPQNPHWFNRDRFVLSNGHGSMILYSLLHLTGYNLSLDDLKHFRQLNSKTPGHPEFGHTPGVETTTGPLGQGLANAVGMALAERVLATHFNQDNFNLVDHYTYTFVGDGCLMEGISHEACSLAGTLGLGKLIVFYDNNGISIDGKIDSWFTDDTATRFKSYHWQVIEAINGHDAHEIEQAILKAQANTTQPTLIICNTVIGLGSSVAGSEKAHGSALGAKDVANVREFFNWKHEPFVIPDSIYQQWSHVEQGQKDEQQWLMLLNEYQKHYPQEHDEFLRRINGDLPDDWLNQSNTFFEQCRNNEKAVATRKASQQCIEYFARLLPEMLGGSADLTGSNNTDWSGSKAILGHEYSGNYLYYGVREFAMAAIMNGIAVHGGFIPYGGTFLVFADYARNAVRLSALMKQRVIYVFTHDSIGLGEDGPTHQPVEHAAMLRMTPGMSVWRPADLMETAVAWQFALEHHNGPTSLLLSRQNLPALPHGETAAELIKKGGYIIKDCDGTPDALLIATGSEVQLAIAAAEQVQTQGLKVRVISMPCAERFLEQDQNYKNQVLPPNIRVRIAIEAASSAYWYQFVGLEGAVIGLDRFGVSAPAAQAYQFLGISVERIVKTLNTLL